MLLFQTDSLLIGGGGGIGPYLAYDFIGAPWHLQVGPVFAPPPSLPYLGPYHTYNYIGAP